MIALQHEKKSQWINISLIMFIFSSFIVPWDAFPRFFIFFIAFPVLLAFLYERRFQLRKTDPLIACAAAIITASTLINFALDHPFNDSFQSFRWGLATTAFISCVFLAARQWQAQSIKYSSIFFVIVAATAVFTLALYFLSGDYPSRIEGFGFMGHPIVGPSGLICLWGAGATLLISNKVVDKKRWFLCILALVPMLVLTVLSQSRGPLISISIYLTALMVVVVLHMGLSRRAFLRFSALFFSTLIIIASSSAPLLDRMIERGDSHRMEIFSAVLSEPPENILIGSGPAADFSATPAGKVLKENIGVAIKHPHNIFLNVYYQSGILVLLVFLLLLAGLINRIITNTTSATSLASGMALMMLILLLNTTDGSRIVAPPSSDWMFFWFPFAFLCGFFSKPEKDNGESHG